ncbi:type II toxin-antitoxin system RelE/ParE family toxin [Verrucomicrobium sp. BvORR034]|uniref:type II toxin-antitoxin system RelE/ParE family toxin n=1 Tax=Verrucomicrobium sp. BvORR034 TaxID=1396418 RepID=UPI000678DC7D|nr:type II toxin-antitoxin system RelE/ParE family toxin [Verrucomicrobium sp. BvORR034]
MARIVWAEPALQDLDQIADYIALDHPPAAKKLVQRVFKKVEMLRTFPELGTTPHDLPDSRYRHLVINPLRVFYRVAGNTIFIVYVMRAERLLQLGDQESRDP